MIKKGVGFSHDNYRKVRLTSPFWALFQFYFPEMKIIFNYF